MSEDRSAPPGPRVPPRRPDRAASAERSGESTSPSARSMRARLARMGTRTQTHTPVLEPLFRAVRANHAKADLALWQGIVISALSLGVGWMVLIAAEMLAQNPGLGKFVWDEFQNGSSQSLARIMVAVFTIGIIGFLLDRVMFALQSAFTFSNNR